MPSNSRSSLQELRALANLVNTSIDQLEQACNAQDKDLPSSHEPFDAESESVLMSPQGIKASSVIVSAASQLLAAVRLPIMTMFGHVAQFHISSCICIAIQAHVAEILRDAGPKGLHARDIAAYTGINSEKLARVLRLLATNYIFREVAPDTFSNNRLSSSLDTGKDVKDIIANPESKYDGTSSITAMLESVSAEGLKSAAHFADIILDQEYTNSGEPNETAFNMAYKTNLPYFEWLSKPEQAYKSKRFATGMHASNSMATPGIILKGFDWEALPKDSVVVDVGGGVGSQTMVLAKAFDHLKLVVQDRETVMVEDAPKFWNAEYPEAISSGRVTLQAHDMFAPQPVREPAVFFLRAITHDWSDDYCVKLLRQLRAAAAPNTQLIVIDNIITYACGDSDQSHEIPGAVVRPTAPSPLLPNWGATSSTTYLGDIHLLTYFNGSERTVPQFAKMFEQSGWKLVRVHAEGFNFHDIKMVGIVA